MKTNDEIEKFLDSIGPIGSEERLRQIATMNLGERSEAARRVCEKRFRRREIMDKGFSFEMACLILEREQNEIPLY